LIGDAHGHFERIPMQTIGLRSIKRERPGFIGSMLQAQHTKVVGAVEHLPSALPANTMNAVFLTREILYQGVTGAIPYELGMRNAIGKWNQWIASR
jgi:hypothetical protein